MQVVPQDRRTVQQLKQQIEILCSELTTQKSIPVAFRIGPKNKDHQQINYLSIN